MSVMCPTHVQNMSRTCPTRVHFRHLPQMCLNTCPTHVLNMAEISPTHVHNACIADPNHCNTCPILGHSISTSLGCRFRFNTHDWGHTYTQVYYIAKFTNSCPTHISRTLEYTYTYIFIYIYIYIYIVRIAWNLLRHAHTNHDSIEEC